MIYRPTFTNDKAGIAVMTAIELMLCATVTLLLSCRRELYVFGDEFHSVTLDTDWRQYSSTNPDGMTVWFYSDDESRQPIRITTASVQHTSLYLGKGRYSATIIDYSPEEFSQQAFVGMDHASTSCVVATPASYQPDTLDVLYGPQCFAYALDRTISDKGLYEVSNQPEQMALDTLQNIEIHSGEYGEYIPYKVRDTYQSSLEMQTIHSIPTSPIKKLRIRIFVKGIDYLWQVEGSIAGLADGRFLIRNRNTDNPCLISLTDWSVQYTGNNCGYISTVINTFGICASQRPHYRYDSDGNPIDDDKLIVNNAKRAYAGSVVDWTGSRLTEAEDLRINLHLVLRDHATTMDYHFDVGNMIASYDEQLVLRLDLGTDYPGLPDLPFVDAYNGTGFGAIVTPWENVAPADVSM